MKTGFFICFGIALCLIQCKPRPKVGDHQNVMQSDTIVDDSTLNISYLMLSPNEVLGEILNDKRKLNPLLVNSKSNAPKYVDAKQQAMNLGVYITDFGYLNLSNNKTNVIDYFRVIRDLAQKNNIYGCFDEAIFNRIQDNLANNDSLLVISQDMYYNMIEILENSNRQKVYALVSSGALIESLYLSVMNVNDFNDYKNIAQKVFDQEKLLENFYKLLEIYKSDKDINSVLIQFDSLKRIISLTDKKHNKRKIIKNKNSHFEIKGGDDFVVNESTFNAFRESVKKTREDIISSSNK